MAARLIVAQEGGFESPRHPNGCDIYDVDCYWLIWVSTVFDNNETIGDLCTNTTAANANELTNAIIVRVSLFSFICAFHVVYKTKIMIS